MITLYVGTCWNCEWESRAVDSEDEARELEDHHRETEHKPKHKATQSTEQEQDYA